MDISNRKIVKVGLRNATAGTKATFYFATNASPEFSGSKQMEYTLVPQDTEFREYLLDFSNHPDWTGTLKQIRFDPVEGVTAGSFQLDYIRIEAAAEGFKPVHIITKYGVAPDLPSTVIQLFSDGTTREVEVSWEKIDPVNYGAAGSFSVKGTVEGVIGAIVAQVTVLPLPKSSWTFTSDTEGWGNEFGISNYGWKDGGYIGGDIWYGDAQFFSPDQIGLDLTDRKLVKIRMQNLTSSTKGTFYFTTTESPNVTASKGIEYTLIPNDTGFTEYVLDFSANPEWKGKLKQIRFDPTEGVTTGSFLLDQISIEPKVETKPPAIIRIETVEVTTTEGIAPVLPSTVEAEYDDGEKAQVAVSWDTIAAEQYASPATFEVKGVVAGTTIPAVASVTVIAKVVEPEPKPDPDPEPFQFLIPGQSENTITVEGGEIIISTDQISNGEVTVSVSLPTLESALKALNNQDSTTLKLSIQSKTPQRMNIQLPAAMVSLLKSQRIEHVQIHTSLATISMDTASMQDWSANASSIFTWVITKIDTALLTDEARSKIGANPVLDFRVLLNGQDIDAAELNRGFTVSLPYQLLPNEHSDQVVAYRVTSEGKLAVVKGSRYDKESGMIRFHAQYPGRYTAAHSTVTFDDIQQSWARSSIEALAARSIVHGSEEGLFEPDRQVTRAEFVKMLIVAFDLTEKGISSDLADLRPNTWYYDAVATAEKLGIVKGNSIGQFGIYEEITRQDISVILYRLQQHISGEKSEQPSTDLTFTDADSIAGYARPAVAAMQLAGIVLGTADGKFLPYMPATKAEATTMLYRFMNSVAM